MKKFFTLLLVLCAYASAFSATYYWVGGSGTWGTAASFANGSGGTGAVLTPVAADIIIFDENSGNPTVTVTGLAISIAQLQLNTTGAAVTVTLSGAATSITMTGNLTISSGCTLNDGGNKITSTNGNLEGSGTHAGLGRIVLSKSGATIASGLSLGNLSINAATLSGNVSVAGDLLCQGTSTTGANILTVGGSIYSVLYSAAATINSTTGGKVVCTGTSTNYSLGSFQVSTVGSNYALGDVITFSAPLTSGGITAKGVVTALSGAAITTVGITDPGSGYTSAPTVASVTSTTGNGATFQNIFISSSTIKFVAGSSNVVIQNLELNNSGGTLQIAAGGLPSGARTLSVSGNLVFNASNTTGSLKYTASTSTLGIGNSGTAATVSMNSTNSISGTGNLIIHSTIENVGTIYFDQTTPGTTNKLNNFTQTFGGVTLGNNVEVAGGFTLAPGTGTLVLGSNCALRVNSGKFPYGSDGGAGSGGNIDASNSTSTIILNGVAVIPTTAFKDGIINNLTINSNSVILKQPVTINGTLSFTNTGCLINAANGLTMGNGSTISRVSSGTIIGGANAFTAIGTITGGSGYTSAPTVVVGTQWAAVSGTTPALNSQFASAGNLYTVTVAGTLSTTAPTFVSGSLANGGATLAWAGVAATATATITTGSVSAVTITSGGSGYLTAPALTFTGGAGSGASVAAGTITPLSNGYPIFGASASDRVNLAIGGVGTSGLELYGTTGGIGNVTLTSSTYTLANSLTINGTLSLSGGSMNVGANTLTFQNGNTPITKPSTGSINVTASSNVVFGTVGNTGGNAFTIPPSAFSSTPNFNNFTVNRDNALTTNTQPLAINGTLSLSGTGVTSLGGSPNTAVNMTINPGAAFTLPDTRTLTVSGNFTINSDAPNGTGTFKNENATGGLTVTGTSTVNQSLQHASALRTWYVSSPVVSATPSPALSVIKSFDETLNDPTPANNWVSSSTMVAKKGYQVVPALAANDIAFTGTLNNGDQNIALTNRGGTDNFAGFNLIGNPYPSYLDWVEVMANSANVTLLRSTTMWYRTKKLNELSALVYQFWTVNGDGVSSPNGASAKIPPMQAFWVRANAAGNLALTNSMRSHAPATDKLLKAPAAKNTNKQMVRLQVSNGTNTDEAVIYTSANANNGLDSYDSPKMSNDNLAIPEIYTTVDNEHLVINSMSSLPLDSPIGLGFVSGSASSFSISANEVANLPSDVKVILKDNVTATETDLTDGISSYTFSPAETSGNRFSVIFRTANGTTDVANPGNDNIVVYCNRNNQIVIESKAAQQEGAKVAVYNSVGQKLVSKQLTTSSTVLVDKFNSGVYFVRINSQTFKVIIK